MKAKHTSLFTLERSDYIIEIRTEAGDIFYGRVFKNGSKWSVSEPERLTYEAARSRCVGDWKFVSDDAALWIAKETFHNLCEEKLDS